MRADSLLDGLDLRAKYRPRRFRHLAQGLDDPAIKSITTALATNRLPTAFLLKGGYGSGKTSIGRLVGQRAICLNQKRHAFEPCAACSSCEAVMTTPRGCTFEGYNEFDVQSAMPRELIKGILDNIPYRKTSGRHVRERVVLLDEFHRLNQKEQEKFVKIIEDFAPRFRCLFILCAADDAKICPAIAQRCTVRRLVLPSVDRCTRHLQVIARAEGHRLFQAEAELLATAAGCVPRLYLNVLQDALLFSGSDDEVSRQAVLDACNMLDDG